MEGGEEEEGSSGPAFSRDEVCVQREKLEGKEFVVASAGLKEGEEVTNGGLVLREARGGEGGAKEAEGKASRMSKPRWNTALSISKALGRYNGLRVVCWGLYLSEDDEEIAD